MDETFKSDSELPDSSEDIQPEKYAKLIEDIQKLCENVVQPLNIKKISDEHKESYGFTSSSNYLERVIRSYRRKMHNSQDMDTVTKVKQLFGLSVPVNANVLNQLRDNAHVEVDTRSRITKYIANDGSLHLEGGHFSRSKTKISSTTESTSQAAKKKKTDDGRIAADTPTPSNTQDIVESSIRHSYSPVNNYQEEEESMRESKYDVHQSTQLMQQQSSSELLSVGNHGQGAIPLQSQKAFLESITSLITTLGLPIDSAVSMEIEDGIRNIELSKVYGYADQLRSDVFFVGLESCLLVLHKNASENCHEESTGFRDFLLLFRMCIIQMKIPEIDNYQLKLKRLIDDPTYQYMRVPMRKMKAAIENLIEIVSP